VVRANGKSIRWDGSRLAATTHHRLADEDAPAFEITGLFHSWSLIVLSQLPSRESTLSHCFLALNLLPCEIVYVLPNLVHAPRPFPPFACLSNPLPPVLINKVAFRRSDLSSRFLSDHDFQCRFFHYQDLRCSREKNSGHTDESRECADLRKGLGPVLIAGPCRAAEPPLRSISLMPVLLMLSPRLCAVRAFPTMERIASVDISILSSAI
jgi:hypothetical protein